MSILNNALDINEQTRQDMNYSQFPLSGVRVIDLTRAMAGPFCTMMLGDMGAEVVKIEPPNGDETREWGPPFVGEESTYFMSVNRNKRSIVIDLRKERGLEILLSLVRKSQVLVENYRPGTTDKLGIGYEKLHRLNPNLIYCSVSGFGQTGPYRQKPGYDIIAFATSGMMSITGEPGRPPVKMGVPVSDICAGMYAAYAIAVSLFNQTLRNSLQTKTSSQTVPAKGTHIDVSMLEGQISWLTHQASSFFATGKNPEPLGSSHPSIAPYQAFKGKDGEYFIVAVGNDDLWRKFCDAIDAPALKNDPRFGTNPTRVAHKPELELDLSQVFSKDTATSWLEKISNAGVPCGPINKLDKVFTDPQVLSRDMVIECEHSTVGKIKQLGIPYHFSDFDFAIRSAPPILGQNTDEILSDLGYDKSEISELRSAKVVG